MIIPLNFSMSLGVMWNTFPIWLTLCMSFFTGISGFFGTNSPVSVTNHLVCLQVLQTMKSQIDAWNTFICKVVAIIFDKIK